MKTDMNKQRKQRQRRFKLGSTISQDLENPIGWQYVGGVWMGKSKMLDVVFDTGSDWLVIEGADCSNCGGDKYNI